MTTTDSRPLQAASGDLADQSAWRRPIRVAPGVPPLATPGIRNEAMRAEDCRPERDDGPTCAPEWHGTMEPAHLLPTRRTS